MNETLDVEEIGRVELSFTERGSGHPIVVLHGGAGPMSVVPWAKLLAGMKPARVITPTHPGFMATPRPDLSVQHSRRTSPPCGSMAAI